MNGEIKRERGQRGPDKKPRKRRAIVVDTQASVVEQIAALKPDQVDQDTYARIPAKIKRARKAVPMRMVSCQVPANIADALDELVDTWGGYGTEKTYVVRHAFIWLLTTYAPQISAEYSVVAPPPDPFTFPVLPNPPPNPNGSRATWDDPGLSEDAQEALRRRMAGAPPLSEYGSWPAQREGVMPPDGAVAPGKALVAVANGEPKAI
jgi:hypothetical protein